jgi:hypothetical protein
MNRKRGLDGRNIEMAQRIVTGRKTRNASLLIGNITVLIKTPLISLTVSGDHLLVVGLIRLTHLPPIAPLAPPMDGPGI